MNKHSPINISQQTNVIEKEIEKLKSQKKSVGGSRQAKQSDRFIEVDLFKSNIELFFGQAYLEINQLKMTGYKKKMKKKVIMNFEEISV